LKKGAAVIDSGGLSHIGSVRQDNQDTIYLSQVDGFPHGDRLFIVADGMGGYAHGSVASSLAVETLIESLQTGGPRKPQALRRGVESANVSVYKAAQRLGAGRMGTTLTAAYIHQDHLHLAHVGDSRAYLVRDQRAVCLTTDHTTVGELVRMKLISADKVRTHAQRSILTRAVGIGLFIKPDLSRHRLCPNDYLLLCSDGAWSVIHDEEFARAVNEASCPEQAARSLVDLALARETDDNASVVAIHIRELSEETDEKQARNLGKWFQNRRKPRQ
jgi:PPM family protein phosphatase